MKENWRLKGYDTFEGEFYALLGQFSCEDDAQNAALFKLKEFEQTQPADETDGQGDQGIQDRVFIQRPDGTQYRFIPVEPEQFAKLQTD